ncbi:MAG: phosphopentomutase [Clostridia bacterium]|nr:phosphopentomutase [Clostridia bacterium]
MKRVIIIVLDSLGIGALPDAASYGDEGSNTLKSAAAARTDFKIPNLLALGLGNIDGVDAVPYVEKPLGAFGRLCELSKGKDTITGHWEIAGILTEKPFKTYPEGFPAAFISKYEAAIGSKVLGNFAASGTEIIEALGSVHEETGCPIVYTSADSVFQIAANTAVIPLEHLYKMCETAREMLVGEWSCGRVIARPYIIDATGKRTRTSDRKDYAVSPPKPTMLDRLYQTGKTVYAVGKISDIFNGSGVTQSVHTQSNADGVDKTIEALKMDFEGLLFTNLVDFDSKFGHRRDAQGYGQAIEDFDARLPEILQALKEGDILMLCADHGNDPNHSGWDHTREAVPLLVYGKYIAQGKNLGTRKSFADISATVLEYIGAQDAKPLGDSFLKEMVK